jgi:arylformamidase
MPMDQATREREYSPSSVIGGGYAEYLQRYRAESAEAFRTVRVERDLRYGDTPRALLDYFPAPVSAQRPGLFVYIHGGYWQELSKEHSAFVAPAWHAAGFACAAVSYTLAPQARLPDIVSECRSALTWLHRQADVLGFDNQAIVVAGSSAGGYLAAACADRSSVPLRGMVCVSGIYDVAPLIGTSINDAIGLDAATAAALDLLSGTRHFCPAVVAWGEIETSEFKRQGREFAARLAADGTPSSSLEISGCNHFDVVLELARAASPLFSAAHGLFENRRD